MWCGGILYGADPDVDHGEIIVIDYSCLYTSPDIPHPSCCKLQYSTIQACYGHPARLHLKWHTHLHPASISTSVYMAINRQPNAGKLRGKRRDVREGGPLTAVSLIIRAILGLGLLMEYHFVVFV